MNAVAEPSTFTREGIYRGIPNEVYHADRFAVSSSALKHILQSPAHFLALRDEPEESTAALRFGTALHAALLEPERYREEYVTVGKINRATKKGKALAAALDAALVGKIRLTAQDASDIERMVESARRDPRVIEAMAGGEVETETTYVWQDEETGVWCKCRPDFLNSASIFDLKSCLDASEWGFRLECKKRMYHLSAAMYVEGVAKLTGKQRPFRFWASEKGRPYAFAVYEGKPAFMSKGARLFRQALRTLKECRESGHWPGYQAKGEIDLIDLPGWDR